MATAWTYDTTNKLFRLDASVLDENGELSIDVRQAYSQVKIDWKDTDALNKFKFPLDSIGGQDIGGGVFIAAYISLKYGWRIVPPEADSSITIVGNLITAEGEDPIVGTDGAWDTVIKYQVSSNSQSISQDELVTQIDGIDTAIQTLPGDMWDVNLETDVSAKHIMQIVVAVLSGKAIITGDNIVFRDNNDTRDVVDATTTADGERTAVTLNVT